MLHHSLGGEVISFSLQHIMASSLNLVLWLYGNLINLTFFGGKALVNKLWPLLYKRAELDLMMTKDFTCHGTVELMEDTQLK